MRTSFLGSLNRWMVQLIQIVTEGLYRQTTRSHHNTYI